MHDGSDSEQVVGIVFPSVDVPASATVLSAKVRQRPVRPRLPGPETAVFGC
jgi:hypothetical protein